MTESPISNPPGGSPPGSGGDIVRDQDKIMLVLAYLGIFCLIPLLTVKDSEYVKWHAKQGLALLLCWVGWVIAGFILGFIPFLGWLLTCLGHLGFLVLMIVAIVRAFEPTRWKIPLVSSLAERF
jgi:fumarate reductase subunit D